MSNWLDKKMKKKTNLIYATLAGLILLTFGSACNSGRNSEIAANSSKPGNYINEDKPTGATPETKTPKIEKADFTTTSEELDKEFTRKGVKDKDLEKYVDKNIAVTGRVSLISLEKKDTTQPWVTLYAPGVLHGVSCYFDDDNLEQMKQLKMDKIVTVQGFQNDFLVPEVSPRLEHCVVIKAD